MIYIVLSLQSASNVPWTVLAEGVAERLKQLVEIAHTLSTVSVTRNGEISEMSCLYM